MNVAMMYCNEDSYDENDCGWNPNQKQNVFFHIFGLQLL